MNREFKITSNKTGSELYLKFSGDINENSEFNNINLEEIQVVHMDFKEVGFVNSVGLRSWIIWVKNFSNLKINFYNCPRQVVDQLNILEGFMPPNATVQSFFVPFYCDECDHTDMVLASRGKDYIEASADKKEGVSLADELPCSQCGQNAEMDVLKERYFNFLKLKQSIKS